MKNDDNVDFHLLLSLVTKIELVTGKSRAGDFETHTVRFYNEGENGASIFVMWKPGEALNLTNSTMKFVHYMHYIQYIQYLCIPHVMRFLGDSEH